MIRLLYTRLLPRIELFASLDYRGPWTVFETRSGERDFELWAGPFYLCASKKNRRTSNGKGPDDHP